MRKLFCLCISLCAVMLTFAGPVKAQNALWVSPTGNDAAICSEATPCATFQGAVNKGSVSQINCLLSGSYGPVTITASITIDCGSGNVGNIISSTPAIQINATSPIKVVLRHLSLNGLGVANAGIITTGFASGSVTVEDCTLQQYTAFAISFITSSGRGLLQVSDSKVIDSGGGIEAAPSSGQVASVTLNRVELSGNANVGLAFVNPGVVAGAMRDSLISSNGGDGIFTTAGQVFFTVEGSTINANLGSGIHTNSAGSNLNVTATTIGANGRGVNAAEGSIVSFGNNTLNGNATDGAFTSTTTLR
jgi:hypothetical protein